jgi:L-fuconolactonase
MKELEMTESGPAADFRARDANAILVPSGAGTWDIVDTQLHFSRESIVPALFAMDALGIRSALLDEYWDVDPNGVFRPGYLLPNGASRSLALTVAAASHEHPSRFSYVLRVNYRDPGLDCVVGNVAADPGGRAIRVAVWTADEVHAFRAGGYAPVFDAAQKYDLPVFVVNPGNPKDLSLYAKTYDDVTIVLDHMGMPRPNEHGEADLTVFDDVLTLAIHPNIALKWAHAQWMFNVREYPFDDLTPFLESALRAFGKERLMWGSDISLAKTDHSWAELLFSVRDNLALSLDERKWMLGGTARTLLKWPLGA